MSYIIFNSRKQMNYNIYVTLYILVLFMSIFIYACILNLLYVGMYNSKVFIYYYVNA